VSGRALPPLALLALVGAPLRAFAEEPPALIRHAVVVGANLGGGMLDPLRYAERDAEAFAAVLSELGGFAEERVTVLYQPTVAQLREALAAHAALAETTDEDLFVFYYSGHADGHGLRLGTETYWFDALKHDVRLIESTARVGVLDACRSGAITRLKGARVAPSLFAGQDQLAARGEVWMTASSADEVAQESESLRGGFFTHYLLSGLRGAAAGVDGLVELQELYAYTRDRVVVRSAEAGGVQRPHFDFNLVGERGIALTDVRRADASLVLGQDRPGHVSVLRVADRVQLVELDVTAERARTVALPPGRYLVRLRDERGLHESYVSLNRSSTARVGAWRAVGVEDSVARGLVPESPSIHDRIQYFRELSLGFFDQVDLTDSPLLAGLSSVVVPGGGQVYNQQPGRGVAFFLGTAALIGGGALGAAVAPEHRGYGHFATATGVALWGGSIADALHGVRRAEASRPRTGFLIGWSMGFSPRKPTHFGLLAEVTPIPHLSLGLERVGVAVPGPGMWDAQVGSRLILAAEGERFRPGVFVAQGVRVGQPEGGTPIAVRGVIGAGALVRGFVAPRYFIELDARWELDQARHGGVFGVGFGVPIGR